MPHKFLVQQRENVGLRKEFRIFFSTILHVIVARTVSTEVVHYSTTEMAVYVYMTFFRIAMVFFSIYYICTLKIFSFDILIINYD